MGLSSHLVRLTGFISHATLQRTRLVSVCIPEILGDGPLLVEEEKVKILQKVFLWLRVSFGIASLLAALVALSMAVGIAIMCSSGAVAIYGMTAATLAWLICVVVMFGFAFLGVHCLNV